MLPFLTWIATQQQLNPILEPVPVWVGKHYSVQLIWYGYLLSTYLYVVEELMKVLNPWTDWKQLSLSVTTSAEMKYS